MSIPIFNKTQLNKQKLQNLNQAYTRISYIQIQCKPFLSKLQKKIIDPNSLIEESGALKIGKRRFLKIVVTKEK